MSDAAPLPIQRLTIPANGIEFTCLAAGSGPPVLCLHGFADRADAWVPLLHRLAAAGYRGVAPYLRGVAPTALATDGDYSLRALAMDTVALIDQLGAPRTALVGHDSGAVIAFAAANLRPDRVSSLVAAGAPHPRRLLLRPSLAQISRAWPKLRLHFGRSAERALARNNFAALEAIIARGAPGFDFRQQAWWIDTKTALAEPGRLTAALNYYRQQRRLFIDPELWRLAVAPVGVPSLLIYGLRDGAVGTEMFAHQEHLFTSHYELQSLQAGHLMHREQTERFNHLVLDFLRRSMQQQSPSQHLV